MKINLMLCTGLLLMFVFLSCKKEASVKESEPVAKDSPVKVVDGVLHFSDDQTFVQTMLAINSMSAEQRQAWEKEIGFTSLRSVYDKFNQELDKMEAAQNKDGFFTVKNKYDRVVVWNSAGTSYDINCRGILEAGVVNAEGLVRINDQLLQYSHDQITTSSIQAEGSIGGRKANEHTIIWARDKKNTLARDVTVFDQSALVAYGQAPVLNQLKMGEGSFANASPMESGVEAAAHAQVKIYNFLLNGQNRGFCTVYYFAEHRNWLGILRRVNTINSGFVGDHAVTLNNQGEHMIYSVGDFGGNWVKGPNWSHGLATEHEVVIIASAALKSNPTTVSYIPPSLNNQFVNADYAITEDGSSNNYWKKYVPFGALGYPLRIKIHSVGTYPSPDTHSYILEFK
ncbi:DUF4848 domain-containing protein [Chitinophaga oryzae]|uniref:DUF4848 domain-containing protein n=1 Tax=Chitinophaga oryzae TaxID=2725414 RepID=A0AAE6ZM99_9BACT|nr:DUF4848 domain-containing protein [Chitinophaga oryzae]QJB35187.1 DUF4848 domain-containing protein [Chitinophaga oryzae]QJB41705.1 DUF4848 domain-containing protein [Chitinophaga oryzae]